MFYNLNRLHLVKCKKLLDVSFWKFVYSDDIGQMIETQPTKQIIIIYILHEFFEINGAKFDDLGAAILYCY